MGKGLRISHFGVCHQIRVRYDDLLEEVEWLTVEYDLNASNLYQLQDDHLESIQIYLSIDFLTIHTLHIFLKDDVLPRYGGSILRDGATRNSSLEGNSAQVFILGQPITLIFWLRFRQQNIFMQDLSWLLSKHLILLSAKLTLDLSKYDMMDPTYCSCSGCHCKSGTRWLGWANHPQKHAACCRGVYYIFHIHLTATAK